MSINRHIGALGVLILFLVGSRAPYAQGPAPSPLATVKSLTCVFPIYATGTWTKEEPQAAVKPAKLSLRFDSIDTQDGTADLIGGFPGGIAPSHIIARLSERSLHLLAIDTSAALYVTTVFDKDRRGGKLKAVHTRHEYTEVSLPGYTSRPEQYYGECEVSQ